MGARELLEDLAMVGVRVQVDGDRLVVEPASLLSDDARAALRAHKAEVLALLTADVGGEAGQPLQEPDTVPADWDHGAIVLDEWQAEAPSSAMSSPQAPGRDMPTTPATEPEEAGCRPCAHRLRRGTCDRPVEAGLSDGGFGIFWAPPGHAATCQALAPRPAGA